MATRLARDHRDRPPLHSAKDLTLEEQAALTAGVEVSTFDACLHNPGIRKSIENDIAEAERIGITGTPGFVIAQRQNGQLEGTLLLGAQPTSAFSTRIEALLGAH